MKLYIVSKMLILVSRSWTHFLLSFKYAVVIIFLKLERLHIFIPGQVDPVLTIPGQVDPVLTIPGQVDTVLTTVHPAHPGKQIHNALFPFTQ